MGTGADGGRTAHRWPLKSGTVPERDEGHILPAWHQNCTLGHLVHEKAPVRVEVGFEVTDEDTTRTARASKRGRTECSFRSTVKRHFVKSVRNVMTTENVAQDATAGVSNPGQVGGRKDLTQPMRARMECRGTSRRGGERQGREWRNEMGSGVLRCW